MAELQVVAAAANFKSLVEAQYVEMKVPLYSYGCHKKIKKALAHLKGIYSIEVEFEEQKVTVWGICNRHQVLGSIRKKRKGACFWKPEPEVEHNTQLLQLDTNTTIQSQNSAPSSPYSHSHTKRPINPAASSKALINLPSWKSWNWKLFFRSYSF